MVRMRGRPGSAYAAVYPIVAGLENVFQFNFTAGERTGDAP